MSQPPKKKVKVASVSAVAGPLRQSKRLQLATRPTPRPDDDVDGAPLTVEAKAERVMALRLCVELRKEVEEASGLTALRAAYRGVEKLMIAFNDAARGRETKYRKETFLWLAFSGLFPTCVDRALKTVEEANFPYCDDVVKIARRLLHERLLRGAEGVTKENLQRCKDFAEVYMPQDEFPDDLDDGMVYLRLNWFLQVKGDTKAYFELFTVETLKTHVLAKLEAIEKWTYSGRAAANELGKVLRDLPWEYSTNYSDPEIEDEEEDDDEEEEDDDEEEEDEGEEDGSESSEEVFGKGHPLRYAPGNPLRDAWDNDE